MKAYTNVQDEAETKAQTTDMKFSRRRTDEDSLAVKIEVEDNVQQMFQVSLNNLDSNS
jgi:hypothetical protein